ncbi:eukaryotic translation initiation factor 2 subunit 2-like isoform X2 [Littorina saxatilis]|uniref:eukaryotic translation initiation factor 2 subunit 2-like isoform X2 n=1 Tax=Littorina saxatilis TaxID=31220 RepID=UPI0038B493C5
MADEDELIPFDLMKKKKKKKKTGFDLDAALNEDGAADGSPSQATENKAEETPASADLEDLSLDMDFGGLKKKKKKKKAFDMEEVGDALPEDGSNQTAGEGGDFGMDDEFSLDLGKKKKKKKSRNTEDFDEEIDRDEEDTGADQPDGSNNKAWSSSDRDYTYDELLLRVFDIMREKNPEMIAGDKKRFVMRPPQVLRVGTRKTSFANFADICRLLHRQPKHVLAFLLAELGTSGSVDGNNQLLIRGKYTQKQIENVLRRYIKEYVTCHTCRSRDTILQKDTRLFFLQCETCGSRCSVASIKTGFQAVTGKRAAIRAKTA